MLNVSISLLSINYMVLNSPLISFNRPTNFQISFSKFSFITNQILYYKSSRFSAINFDRILVANTLMSFATCKTLPDKPTNSPSSLSGCVVSADTSYKFQDSASYEFSGANFSVTNCRFDNCTGSVLALFRFTSTAFIFENSSISNCQFSLMENDTPLEGSKIVNSTFNMINNLGTLTGGDMNMIDCSFNGSTAKKQNSASYFTITMCTTVIIRNCAFNGSLTSGSNSVINAESTIDLRVINSNFNLNPTTLLPIKLDDSSYAMIIGSCFNGGKGFTGGQAATKNVFVDKAQCPYIEPTVALTSEKQAFAISTVVIFSIAFAALFITLIALVFCRSEDETVKYGKLHLDAVAGEDQDSNEISD